MRRIVSTLVVLAVLALPASSLGEAVPVGPLPKSPTTSIATKKGLLVSVALKSRAGLSWRVARAIDPKVLVQVSEANVGSSVVLVFRAVGRGHVNLAFGLTRGETKKAYAAARYDVRVS
jgi:hypothetical protein